MPPAAEVPFLWPGTYGRCPYRDGGPGISPLDVLKDAGTRAGVAGVTWQVLRRSLATALEGAGVPPGTIARVLRHSEEVSKLYYRQADHDTIRAAVSGLVF